MRLWSLDPTYLDAKGLVALWREGLLAQKVLSGETRGYRNHPQLERFLAHPDPTAAIAAYLHAVCDEADGRGYRFNHARLSARSPAVARIEVSDGQMRYELRHLLSKLNTRDPDRFERLSTLDLPVPHPSFGIVPGPIASWERPAPMHRQVQGS